MLCTWGARGNDFPNLVFDLVDGIARAANPPELTTPFDDKVGSGYVSSKKLENCSNDYHSSNHAVSRCYHENPCLRAAALYMTAWPLHPPPRHPSKVTEPVFLEERKTFIVSFNISRLSGCSALFR